MLLAEGAVPVGGGQEEATSAIIKGIPAGGQEGELENIDTSP